MIHELKILPEYFDAVNCGKKNFEIRLNDRNYQEDDELILREWNGEEYTGRECHRWVGYIYYGNGEYGVAAAEFSVKSGARSPLQAMEALVARLTLIFGASSQSH